MNVLIYVMTMLMLLSALTYAKIDIFRSTASLQVGFINYMETLERKPINDMAYTWYRNLIVNVEPNVLKSDAPKPSQKKPVKEKSLVKANSRLSFYLLLNEKKRTENAVAYRETIELTKHLIALLYSQETFYKDVAAERPNFVTEMLEEISNAASKLGKNQKITKATRLSKLEFNDKKLQYVFYLMLHGLPKPAPKPVDPSAANTSSELQPGEKPELDTQDDPVAAQESQEEHAEVGYVSLLDYITVRPYIKTRVYLASRALLKAIYEDDKIVDEVIEMRNELYRRVREKPIEKVGASAEFMQAFQLKGQAQSYPAILDFSVSNVDPRNYE